MASRSEHRIAPAQRWLRGGPLLALQVARGITVVVFGCIYTVAFTHILSVSEGFEYVALSALYILALLWLQLFYFSRPAARPKAPAVYLALLVQVGLVYLPLLQFGQNWVGLPGFLAGSLLLVLPPVLGWIGFLLVVASMGVIQSFLTHQVLDITYTMVSTVITGLVVYGLTRLAALVEELHAARSELARMAVAQERLRFARDLHDLLGYSLSAITLKAELTRRLVGVNPERARDELADLLDVSRQALADVRMVASGYRNMSLSKEAASVVSLLSTAGITAQVDINCGPLDEGIDTVLATVLREAVTNMLRHSTAQNCTVEASGSEDAVTLRVTNDGVPGPGASRRDGGGLENLALRLEAIGGSLTTRIGPDGRFDVLATVPIPVESGPPAGEPPDTKPPGAGPAGLTSQACGEAS
jgi:two-component system sensor histidine kinase DesK